MFRIPLAPCGGSGALSMWNASPFYARGLPEMCMTVPVRAEHQLCFMPSYQLHVPGAMMKRKEPSVLAALIRERKVNHGQDLNTRQSPKDDLTRWVLANMKAQFPGLTDGVCRGRLECFRFDSVGPRPEPFGFGLESPTDTAIHGRYQNHGMSTKAQMSAPSNCRRDSGLQRFSWCGGEFGHEARCVEIDTSMAGVAFGFFPPSRTWGVGYALLSSRPLGCGPGLPRERA